MIIAYNSFQYLMKLHYSQTGFFGVPGCGKVSVPYEITLLSNLANLMSYAPPVSVPYEITLLSNRFPHVMNYNKVSVPYEITLLSNKSRRRS